MGALKHLRIQISFVIPNPFLLRQLAKRVGTAEIVWEGSKGNPLGFP
jgi:hypothetical protein